VGKPECKAPEGRLVTADESREEYSTANEDKKGFFNFTSCILGVDDGESLLDA